MLYTLSKNTTSSLAIESAMDELRQIIGHRIQAHLNQNQFLFGKYVSEKLNGDFIKEDIAQHLPQIPTPEEWIILITALIPHVRPNFFESAILEQLPNGGDFPEFGGVKAQNHY